MNAQKSNGSIAKLLGSLYADAGVVRRAMAVGRPFICPFDELIASVPKGGSVLDIGCGSGVFLNLLEASGKLGDAVGIDTSPNAICAAQRAYVRISRETGRAEFQCRAIEDGLPERAFDVVSMIDVLHHVDPKAQKLAVTSALSRVGCGGYFLYKDIGEKPVWRATANRMHDLILAREWIHYIPAAQVIKWVCEEDFDLMHSARINMLWYGHELLVFQRPED